MIIAAAAFDVGMVLTERRDEQNAADAAALAGARYVLTDPVKAEATARRIAQINGFDDADPNEVVTVHIPAISGRYAGFPGFIQVDIQGTRPSIFGGIIGQSDWAVGVMAVATNRQDLIFPFSMLALNPTACKAIQVSGTGLIQAFANIQSNSNGSDCGTPPYGFSRTGGSTIDVIADDATCRSVGLIQDQGSGPPMTCDKVENSFALPDPLRNLPAPTKPPIAAAPVWKGSGAALAVPKNCPGGSQPPTELVPRTCKLAASGAYKDTLWLLSPGLYPGGIDVSNGTVAYLLPGIYWIGGGGLSESTGGSIFTVANATDAKPTVAASTWGGGVMIYNSQLPTSAAGVIDMNGNAPTTLKLKALDVPAGDPNEQYNNIVIFQDRTVATDVRLNGAGSIAEVEGIVYVPKGHVQLNGNGGTLILDQVIADTYTINGGGGTIKVLRNTGVDAHISAAGLVD
jgi:hypothetical protein